MGIYIAVKDFWSRLEVVAKAFSPCNQSIKLLKIFFYSFYSICDGFSDLCYFIIIIIFFFVLKKEKESAAHALFLLNSRWRCERSYPLHQVKDELSVVSALELQSLFVLCGDQSSSCKRSRPHVS